MARAHSGPPYIMRADVLLGKVGSASASTSSSQSGRATSCWINVDGLRCRACEITAIKMQSLQELLGWRFCVSVVCSPAFFGAMSLRDWIRRRGRTLPSSMANALRSSLAMRSRKRSVEEVSRENSLKKKKKKKKKKIYPFLKHVAFALGSRGFSRSMLCTTYFSARGDLVAACHQRARGGEAFGSAHWSSIRALQASGQEIGSASAIAVCPLYPQ